MSARARLATTATMAVLAAATLAGCSNGPLDTSCEEFLTLSSSEQHTIAVAWAMDSLKQQDMAEASANTALPSMVAYCQSDPDAKIGDLQYSFGR